MARSTFARLVAKVAVGALAVVTPVALLPVAASAVAPTELFFSEYIEGSSNNKAIEIYNGTGGAVNLATGVYNVQMFFNGSTSAGLTVNLTGTVASGDVFVLAQATADPAILAQADQTNGSGWFNGDDAVVLRKDTTVLDVIGQLGVDPGAEWGSDLTSTADNTLTRKPIVCAGDADGSNAFDPSVQWDGFAVNTFGGLGAHTADCSDTPPAEQAPAVTVVTPAGAGSARVSPTVTFSEDVVLDEAFTLECTLTGDVPVTVTGGPLTFTVDPTPRLTYGETCTLTVHAAGVADLDTNDPPDAMVADRTSTFTVDLSSACASPATPIPAIQGSGATVALSGPQTVRGVVVGDYEGATPGLRGFYLQDVVGDSDTATSDGIFIFNFGNENLVEVGDLVTVTGTAGENQGQSQISTTAANIADCGTGTVAPTGIALPMLSATDFERYEGMLVTTTQPLYVTEHFQLGRFGQVVVSSGDRLQQPTNVVAPGTAAIDLQAENNLNRLIVDDASQAQNPDPILFGGGGDPLTAENTLRGGDVLTEAVGVMTYTWAGNAASPNAYRLRPVNALGASYDFEVANERPQAPTEVGGDVKAASMNLLNYFNTFTGCTLGAGGGTTGCRGANNAAEFDRQWPKTVEAITKVDADVIGVNEVENDGYTEGSALDHLVDRLNDELGAGTYAYLDVDGETGQTNALGTDAIKVGMLYKPAKVTPVGQTAALNSVAFVNGGDSAPRSRPSLAQAFEVNATGGVFVADVNHLKSKGSACDAPDAGDGQGNCAAVRRNAAEQLVAWLDSDPTGTGEDDVLILGDLNSYAKEDTITTIETAGYTNLVESFLGQGDANPYSYVFDGQWGYLDHALASGTLLNQVDGVAEYHINADEPAVLDYNTEFKTASQALSLYAPDEFRVSDHDPVIVGLSPTAPLEAAFADGLVPCGDDTASLTVTHPARYPGDTHSVTIEWGDGSMETVETASSPLTRTHTYAAAGRYTATVTVTDSHGHVRTTTADVAVEFTTTGVLPPFKNGTVTAKSGSTVPVKVELVDCDGSEPTDLEPTVSVTLGSTVVRTGSLAYVDGKWLYQLKTTGLAAGTYTVTVTVPETGQTITATVRVRT